MMLTSFVVYGLLGVMGAVVLLAAAAAVLMCKRDHHGPDDDDDTDDTDIYGDEYRTDAGHAVPSPHEWKYPPCERS